MSGVSYFLHCLTMSIDFYRSSSTHSSLSTSNNGNLLSEHHRYGIPRTKRGFSTIQRCQKGSKSGQGCILMCLALC